MPEAVRFPQPAAFLLAVLLALTPAVGQEPDPPAPAVAATDPQREEVTDSAGRARRRIEEWVTEYERQIAERVAEVEESRRRLAGWREKVSALADPVMDPEDREAAAEDLFLEVSREAEWARSVFATGLSVLGAEPATIGRAPGDMSPGHVELRNRLRELQLRTRTQIERAVVSLYRDLEALKELRIELLELVSPRFRLRMIGFGRDGVLQARGEFHLLAQELRYATLAYPKILERIVRDLRLTPALLVGSLTRLLVLLAAFGWWRRRSPDLLRGLARRSAAAHHGGEGKRWLADLLFYVERIRSPLEWLLLLYLAQKLIEPQYLPDLVLPWTVARWMLLGWAGVLLLDAGVSRGGELLSEAGDTPALRHRSLRLMGALFVASGLSRSLLMSWVGNGTLLAWLGALSTAGLLIVLIVLVGWWRPMILAWAQRGADQSRVLAWVAQSGRSFLSTLVGGAYLLSRWLGRLLVAQLANLDQSRRWLARLARREIDKSSSSVETTPVPREIRERFTAPDGTLYEDLVEAELAGLLEAARSGRGTVSFVVGEPGSGKSSLLRLFAERLGEGAVVMSCPFGGISEFRRALADRLGEEPDTTAERLQEILRSDRVSVLCLDDAHRLVQPMVGGLEALDYLVQVSRLAGAQISWLISFDAAAWRFIRGARRDSLFADRMLRLDGWKEEAIGDLIQRRTAELGLSPDFEALTVPRQIDHEEDVQGERRAQATMQRILWDASDGNPAVALHLWSRSLIEGHAPELPRVHLFQPLPSSEIENLPPTVLFVLRATLQLEAPTLEDLVRCTTFQSYEVANAMRLGVARGYLVPRDDRVQVSLSWYRTITRTLVRHNLLAL